MPPSQKARWAALSSVRTLTFSGSALIGGLLSDSYGYESRQTAGGRRFGGLTRSVAGPSFEAATHTHVSCIAL